MILQKTLSIRELALIAHEINLMYCNGISLQICMEKLLERKKNSGLSMVLRDIAANLNEGKPLSQSFPGMFPSICAHMVLSCEKMNDLELAWQNLDNYLSTRARWQERFSESLGNSFLQVFIAMACTGFLAALHIPRVQASVSLLILAVLGICFFSYKAQWHSMPLLGKAFQHHSMFDFFLLWHVSLKSGVEMSTIFEIASKTNNHIVRKIAEHCLLAQRQCEAFELGKFTQVLPAVSYAMDFSQRAGALTTYLNFALQIYEAEMEYELTRIGKWMRSTAYAMLFLTFVLLALGVF